MRKGFSLVECITVLAVIAVISIPLARLSKFMMYDIPKSDKIIETNTSILDALKYIKKDINSAIGFPKSFHIYSTSEKCLLIEQKNNLVCYLLQDGRISRLIISGNGSGDTGENISWQIPDGKIEWQVWRKNGIGYAVEIKKYVELKSYNRVDKKMPNSHVYFAGAYSAFGETSPAGGQEAVNPHTNVLVRGGSIEK